MEPKLHFDVMVRIAQEMEIWQGLRMGRMNRRLNSAVFNHAVRYVYENPHRYRALQPIEYAFVNGNLELLTFFRDIVVSSNVRAPQGWSHIVDFGSVVREVLDFDSMRQCLSNPEGYKCLELLIDTAISTSTVPSLDLWGIDKPSMLLGNSIKENQITAVAVILRRRTELGLSLFLDEMCIHNIPVIDGYLSQFDLTTEMIECLIVCTGLPFHTACNMGFATAVDFMLRNHADVQNNIDHVLAGFDHLLECVSWHGHPDGAGRNILGCIMVLSGFIQTKTGQPVPANIAEKLLNQIWRVIIPFIRYEGGYGDAEGVTQEQLIDVMIQSARCQQYARIFNTIIDLNPRYSYIPRTNADGSPRLGQLRFVDLVRHENISLPLNFNWNSWDEHIFSGFRS